MTRAARARSDSELLAEVDALLERRRAA